MRATTLTKTLENAGVPHLLTEPLATARVVPTADGRLHGDRYCRYLRVGEYPSARQVPLAEVLDAQRNNLWCDSCFTEMPRAGSSAYRATVALAQLLRTLRLAEGDLRAAATPTARRLFERDQTLRTQSGELQSLLGNYGAQDLGAVYVDSLPFIERANETSARLQEAQKDPHARASVLEGIANAIQPWELTHDAPTVLALIDDVHQKDRHLFTPFEVMRTDDFGHLVYLAPAYAAQHLAYVAASSQIVAPIMFPVRGSEASLREALHRAANLEDFHNLVATHP